MARGSPKNPEIPVILECHHDFVASPVARKGDSVWCRRCTRYRLVVSGAGYYKIRCRVCARLRTPAGCGADLRKARKAATKHVNDYAHIVDIYLNSILVETLKPSADFIPDLAINQQKGQSSAGGYRTDATMDSLRKNDGGNAGLPLVFPF